jgi:uncharacterized protein YdhG (YjbR/CyaY superfamily)
MIEQYAAQFPELVQERLHEMYRLLKPMMPDAEEKMSYGMPSFHLNGPLVYFGGFKTHIGFYPTGEGIAAFQDRFDGLKWSKGAVQFPLDQPFPEALIRDMVEHRIAINLNKIKK